MRPAHIGFFFTNFPVKLTGIPISFLRSFILLLSILFARLYKRLPLPFIWQLEVLRRAGATPTASRRCGVVTRREAECLVKSFVEDSQPPRLPSDFVFNAGGVVLAASCRPATIAPGPSASSVAIATTSSPPTSFSSTSTAHHTPPTGTRTPPTSTLGGATCRSTTSSRQRPCCTCVRTSRWLSTAANGTDSARATQRMRAVVLHRKLNSQSDPVQCIPRSPRLNLTPLTHPIFPTQQTPCPMFFRPRRRDLSPATCVLLTRRLANIRQCAAHQAHVQFHDTTTRIRHAAAWSAQQRLRQRRAHAVVRAADLVVDASPHSALRSVRAQKRKHDDSIGRDSSCFVPQSKLAHVTERPGKVRDRW